MKLLKLTFLLSVFAALGGCVAVPVGGYYSDGPGYYAPAPVYYGPSVSIGVHRGWHGGGHRHHRHHR